MKRAVIAQRLAFILFFVALTSIALGAPPEHAQGEPPPFKEDCVFENGRTTCIVEVTGPETYITSMLTPAGTCDGGTGTLYKVFDLISAQKVTKLIVYFGTSHIIESEEVLETSAGAQVSWVLRTTSCKS